MRAYFEQLINLVADVLVEAGNPPEGARRHAMTTVAVIQGGYVLAQALRSPTAMEQAVAGLVDLLGIGE